jgi:YesN/AraC family two-component response regulator
MCIEMSLNRKLRVLIADDVHETRRNTRVMLSLIDGVEVVAIAMNGLQAVEMAMLTQPDIVVLDINMPELNGLAAYKRISQASPHIACIIISAEKDPATLRAAMSIGIQNYLIKPFSANELEAAINEVSNRLETAQKNSTHTDQLREKNAAYLKQLAEEYTKAKRTDDQAIEVFEELSKFPDCDLRHIQNLAMIYVVRQKWDRLKMLAEKIEQKTK